MANSNRYVGSAIVVGWGATFGTVISGDVTAFSWTEKTDTVEKTAGSEQVKTYITLQTGVDISMSTYDAGTDLTPGSLFYAGQSGTLWWAPEGTADGKPAYQLPVIVSGDDHTTKFNDITKRDLTFMANGAWTKNYLQSGNVWASGTIN